MTDDDIPTETEGLKVVDVEREYTKIYLSSSSLFLIKQHYSSELDSHITL